MGNSVISERLTWIMIRRTENSQLNWLPQVTSYKFTRGSLFQNIVFSKMIYGKLF